MRYAMFLFVGLMVSSYAACLPNNITEALEHLDNDAAYESIKIYSEQASDQEKKELKSLLFCSWFWVNTMKSWALLNWKVIAIAEFGGMYAFYRASLMPTDIIQTSYYDTGAVKSIYVRTSYFKIFAMAISMSMVAGMFCGHIAGFNYALHRKEYDIVQERLEKLLKSFNVKTSVVK